MSSDNSLNIIIKQQPEWISDDDIVALLHDAHKSTLEAGMHYSVLNQKGTDIRKRIGKDGVFFVALLDGKELVGVSGITYNDKSKAWYLKGKPYYEVKLEGVKPDFKGKGINGLLHREIYNYAFNRVDVLVTHTAEHNNIVIRNDLSRGWKLVDFASWKTTDYYSVVMAKWKNKCPYTTTICNVVFILKKYKTKIMKNQFGQYRAFFGAMKHFVIMMRSIFQHS